MNLNYYPCKIKFLSSSSSSSSFVGEDSQGQKTMKEKGKKVKICRVCCQVMIQYLCNYQVNC